MSLDSDKKHVRFALKSSIYPEKLKKLGMQSDRPLYGLTGYMIAPPPPGKKN